MSVQACGRQNPSTLIPTPQGLWVNLAEAESSRDHVIKNICTNPSEGHLLLETNRAQETTATFYLPAHASPVNKRIVLQTLGLN